MRTIHPAPDKKAVGQPESAAASKAKDTKIPSPGPRLLYGDRLRGLASTEETLLGPSTMKAYRLEKS